MDTNKQALLETIACGESNRLQFKADFKNANQLAAEMVAFANSGGGRILVGVTDDGSIAGLLAPDIGRLNQPVGWVNVFLFAHHFVGYNDKYPSTNNVLVGNTTGGTLGKSIINRLEKPHSRP